MLSHLQKLITLLLIVAAGGWLLYFRSSAPWLALGGCLLIALGHSGFLAIEFLASRHLSRKESAPRVSAKELLRAWLGESWTAPQVFCWRQPFRAQAIADQLAPPAPLQGQRGVVFVHGFFCNRGFWTPWLKRLQGGKHAFVALSLEPPFGSIDDYAPQIDAAVQRVTQASGMAPLLVCHSMGGLAVRAWLKHMKAEARVHHVVTLGSPHRGTWLARFGLSHNSLQMRRQSDWLAELDRGMPAHRHALFSCWYSNSDNIVFPVSTATLPGADNRLLRGAGHVQLAFLPQVMDATLALLDDNTARP
ncbi:Alpha/beta hydrolase family protein [Polaromonas sp. OV174]|uniref:esterase/lipase family protein n=1 Tax=Polaromonas sp. OV174 TaxID=1855300 RepID=UPI0008F2CC61|nr:alpha/beta fold hydrolase [Polaromonas sp. OV174]SFB92445.1 Alpha/beta hydrolase family protein [Polaromonas sp. OV174]